MLNRLSVVSIIAISLVISSITLIPCATAEPLTAERQKASPETARQMLAECPKIAFVRREGYGMNGTNAVMFAIRTGVGSEICVYDPASATGSASATGPSQPDVEPEVIFATERGFILNMNPSYDGQKLVFSYKTDGDQPFHIWEINVDGTGLRQLTDGRYHDFSPVYYPDGRIIFSSSRVESYSYCQNYIACALHVMNGDGSDLRRFDFTTLSTLTPAVMSDGSILCTRWEYQDKNIFGWEGLWTIRPDGRNLRLYHGNTFRIPNAVYGARQIPGTSRVITTWAAHHRVPIGDLAVIDRSLGLESPDSMWKVTNVTPVKKDLAQGDDWRKTGVGSGPADTLYERAFVDPFPFTSELTVTSYGGETERHSLYLLNHNTGDTCLLYATDPTRPDATDATGTKTSASKFAGCFSAVPLSLRELPPAIPGDCPQEPGLGTFYVQNVQEGLGQKGVENGTVKALRIMSQQPKKYNTEGPRYHDHYPVVGHGSYYIKENHGTVPVAEDGSAYFMAPSNTELYFIALDERGREVQRMGSVTQITTGEFVSCVGCHEDRLASPPTVNAMAGMGRRPDTIRPPNWGAGPVDYVTQVQPILDKYCVECHSGANPDGPEGQLTSLRCPLDLSGDKSRFYNQSYETLVFNDYVDYYYINHGPNGVFPPQSTGSWVSRLADLLESEHGDINIDVDDESRRCIYAWIDGNVQYYSSWEITRPYTTGGRDAYAFARVKPDAVDPENPTRSEVETGMLPWVAKYNKLWSEMDPNSKFKVGANGGNTFDPKDKINLTHPEWSRVLLDNLSESSGGTAPDDKPLFQSKDDPNYNRLLEILQQARREFDACPTIEYPNAKPIKQQRDFGRTY